MFSSKITFATDTGAVTTAVDTSIASAYWAQVDGAFDAVGDGSGWEYPCGAMLPDFNLYVNGQTIALPGSVLAWTTGGPVASKFFSFAKTTLVSNINCRRRHVRWRSLRRERNRVYGR